MQSPDEIFDVVDEHDRVTGQATRREVHARHLRHRAIHVLLFNTHGELLVQKRSATKDTFPGCCDSSASGHLDAGEDYDACAYREVREELGLALPSGTLTKHFQLPATEETGWEFVWIYSVRGDYRVTPHPGEIERVDYLSRQQLADLLIARPETCARAFRLIVREAIARGLFP